MLFSRICQRIVHLNEKMYARALAAILMSFLSVALTLWFGNIWKLPPYWDSITGIFREALWLVDNDWNYQKLAFEEKGYRAGGPRTYFFSLVPALVGLLLQAVQVQIRVFVALKLLNVALAYLVLVRTYTLGRILELNRRCATAATVMVGLTPIFASQTFSMNMEVALALCVVSALIAYSGGRAVEVFVWLTVAIFLKHTGALLCVTFLVAEIGWGVLALSSYRLKMILAAAIPFALSMGMQVVDAEFFFNPGVFFFDPGLEGSFNLPGLASWPWDLVRRGLAVYRVAPEVVLLLLVAIFATVTYVLQNFHDMIREGGTRSNRAFIAIAIHSFLWAGCVLVYTPFLARYLVCVLSGMAILCLAAVQAKKRVWLEASLGVVTLFCLVRWVGALLPLPFLSLPTNNGDIIESSARVFHAIARDMAAAKHLESVSPHQLLAVSWPLSIVLKDHRYGYVAGEVPNIIDLSKFSGRNYMPEHPELSILVQFNYWSDLPQTRCEELFSQDYFAAHGLPKYLVCKKSN